MNTSNYSEYNRVLDHSKSLINKINQEKYSNESKKELDQTINELEQLKTIFMQNNLADRSIEKSKEKMSHLKKSISSEKNLKVIHKYQKKTEKILNQALELKEKYTETKELKSSEESGSFSYSSEEEVEDKYSGLVKDLREIEETEKIFNKFESDRASNLLESESDEEESLPLPKQFTTPAIEEGAITITTEAGKQMKISKFLKDVGEGGYKTAHLFEKTINKLKVAALLPSVLKEADRVDFGREVRVNKHLKTNKKEGVNNHLCLAKKIVVVRERKKGEMKLFHKQEGLMMDYYNLGDLKHNLDKIMQLPPAERIDILRFIAIGTQTLHANNIVHRDLKLDNIFCKSWESENSYERNKIGDVAIGDFGKSGFIGEEEGKNTSEIETVYNPIMPPEILASEDLQTARKLLMSPKVDTYSAGILFYQVLTGVGELPFAKKPRNIEKIQTLRGDGNPNKLESWPKFKEISPPELQQLIKDMTNDDPNLRPDFSSVVTRLDDISKHL